MEVFQSAPLTRGETIGGRSLAVLAGISIHSPHARGDVLGRPSPRRGDHFNPLPSCEGRRFTSRMFRNPYQFQSTPLMRGETLHVADVPKSLPISIHSPHARGDDVAAVLDVNSLAFQSTPLMRGETGCALIYNRDIAISIHSPHARGDDFWYRDPHTLQISIHSPHARGDHDCRCFLLPLFHFNPLPSCEGRPVSWPSSCVASHFNPLPSCEGRQHKPPKIHPDLRQLTQQNHDTPLFEALQAPFCGAKPDIRGAKPTGKP